MKDYIPRITDSQLDSKLESGKGVLILGPKGCGKTTSAKKKAKTFVRFRSEEKRKEMLDSLMTDHSKPVSDRIPILIDDFQDSPGLSIAVSKYIEESEENGLFILTGHPSKETDALKSIQTLMMYPMSLYESGESNGTVSLIGLFNDPDSYEGCISDLSIDGLIFAICRGGWPKSLEGQTDKAKLDVVKTLFRKTCFEDMISIDDTKRDPRRSKAVLWAYSRNICTSNKTKKIMEDVNIRFKTGKNSYYDYIKALERLCIIQDIDSWCPPIKSETTVKASRKRNLIDPSIAVAAMGLSPQYFNTDFKTLGFLFESLCIRDLKIYSSQFDSDISYYHDRYGLEADGVMRLNDGRYALIEFKLGASQIDEGAKHLLKIESLIKEHNGKEKQCPISLPVLKIVITGTKYGYRREDGVLVIPIGCLKN